MVQQSVFTGDDGKEGTTGFVVEGYQHEGVTGMQLYQSKAWRVEELISSITALLVIVCLDAECHANGGERSHFTNVVKKVNRQPQAVILRCQFFQYFENDGAGLRVFHRETNLVELLRSVWDIRDMPWACSHRWRNSCHC